MHSTVDRLLAELQRHDTIDLLNAFAYPLAIDVIAEVVGAPPGDRGNLELWMHQIFDPSREDSSAGFVALTGYASELIADKRATPTDDLLSAMIEARDGEDRMTELELVANVASLVGAGFETTANLLGNGMLALFDHPTSSRNSWTNPH